MKVWPFVPLMLLAMATAYADQQSINTERTQQRFQEMQSTIDKARAAQGKERHQLMQKHMQMMHERMQEMRGMMGQEGEDSLSGKEQGSIMDRGDIGQKKNIQQGSMEENYQKQLKNMQRQIDKMQQMLEQMTFR